MTGETVATDVRIRPPTEADLPVIAALIGQLGYPTTVAAVRERLTAIERAGGQHLLVAEVDGQVAGLAAVQITRPVQMDGARAELATLVTDDRYRRRGVARALVAEAESIASREGCALFFLRTNKRRAESHDFYRALGFRETHLDFEKELQHGRRGRS